MNSRLGSLAGRYAGKRAIGTLQMIILHLASTHNDDHTHFSAEYPEELSRGTLLLKSFFGIWYCALPHLFVLMFVALWGAILRFCAWWVVLITGNYPSNWYEFNVGLMRWSLRVNMYLSFLTDEYPPFSLDEQPGESNDSTTDGELDEPIAPQDSPQASGPDQNTQEGDSKYQP